MVTCPVCKQSKPLLPLFTQGTTLKQALIGRWVCEYCKSEMDWKGELIKKNSQGLKEYEGKLYKEEFIKEKARLQAQKEFNQQKKR